MDVWLDDLVGWRPGCTPKLLNAADTTAAREHAGEVQPAAKAVAALAGSSGSLALGTSGSAGPVFDGSSSSSSAATPTATTDTTDTATVAAFPFGSSSGTPFGSSAGNPFPLWSGLPDPAATAAAAAVKPTFHSTPTTSGHASAGGHGSSDSGKRRRKYAAQRVAVVASVAASPAASLPSPTEAAAAAAAAVAAGTGGPQKVANPFACAQGWGGVKPAEPGAVPEPPGSPHVLKAYPMVAALKEIIVAAAGLGLCPGGEGQQAVRAAGTGAGCLEAEQEGLLPEALEALYTRLSVSVTSAGPTKTTTEPTTSRAADLTSGADRSLLVFFCKEGGLQVLLDLLTRSMGQGAAAAGVACAEAADAAGAAGKQLRPLALASSRRLQLVTLQCLGVLVSAFASTPSSFPSVLRDLRDLGPVAHALLDVIVMDHSPTTLAEDPDGSSAGSAAAPAAALSALDSVLTCLVNSQAWPAALPDCPLLLHLRRAMPALCAAMHATGMAACAPPPAASHSADGDVQGADGDDVQMQLGEQSGGAPGPTWQLSQLHACRVLRCCVSQYPASLCPALLDTAEGASHADGGPSQGGLMDGIMHLLQLAATAAAAEADGSASAAPPDSASTSAELAEPVPRTVVLELLNLQRCVLLHLSSTVGTSSRVDRHTDDLRVQLQSTATVSVILGTCKQLSHWGTYSGRTRPCRALNAELSEAVVDSMQAVVNFLDSLGAEAAWVRPSVAGLLSYRDLDSIIRAGCSTTGCSTVGAPDDAACVSTGPAGQGAVVPTSATASATACVGSSPGPAGTVTGGAAAGAVDLVVPCLRILLFLLRTQGEQWHCCCYCWSRHCFCHCHLCSRHCYCQCYCWPRPCYYHCYCFFMLLLPLLLLLLVPALLLPTDVATVCARLVLALLLLMAECAAACYSLLLLTTAGSLLDVGCCSAVVADGSALEWSEVV